MSFAMRCADIDAARYMPRVMPPAMKGAILPVSSCCRHALLMARCRARVCCARLLPMARVAEIFAVDNGAIIRWRRRYFRLCAIFFDSAIIFRAIFFHLNAAADCFF